MNRHKFVKEYVTKRLTPSEITHLQQYKRYVECKDGYPDLRFKCINVDEFRYLQERLSLLRSAGRSLHWKLTRKRWATQHQQRNVNA